MSCEVVLVEVSLLIWKLKNIVLKILSYFPWAYFFSLHLHALVCSHWFCNCSLGDIGCWAELGIWDSLCIVHICVKIASVIISSGSRVNVKSFPKCSFTFESEDIFFLHFCLR